MKGAPVGLEFFDFGDPGSVEGGKLFERVLCIGGGETLRLMGSGGEGGLNRESTCERIS